MPPNERALSSLQAIFAPEGEGALPWIRALNSRALRPDLTIVLDVPESVARARREARGGRPELFEVQELQRRLSVLYSRAEELLIGERVHHVEDGSVDEVAARILEVVLAH